MADYIIQNKYENTSPEHVWDIVKEYMNVDKIFNSSYKKIEYKAEMRSNSIFFKGGKEGSKRAKDGQEISKMDFLNAFRHIQKAKSTNSNKIKEVLHNNFNATPLVGLFLTVGVIKKIE